MEAFDWFFIRVVESLCSSYSRPSIDVMIVAVLVVSSVFGGSVDVIITAEVVVRSGFIVG